MMTMMKGHEFKKINKSHMRTYRWPKKLAPSLYALTSSNVNRFSKLFRCQNQEKICNNTVTKDPTTSQVFRYTTLTNGVINETLGQSSPTQ